MISAYHSVSLKILKRALEIKGIFPQKIGNSMWDMSDSTFSAHQHLCINYVIQFGRNIFSGDI